MRRVLRAFSSDQQGNVAVVFGLAVLPLMGMAGAALDYTRAANVRSQLQGEADRAALAAARPMGLAEADRIALANQFFPSAQTTPVDPTKPPPAFATRATVLDKTVTVTVTRQVPTAVMSIMGVTAIPVSARSTAQRGYQGPPVCVLALNPTENNSVVFSGSSSFTAEGCVVQANSSASEALSISGSATVTAAGFCAYGGVSAPSTQVPQPLSRCDRQDDPFKNLAQAQAGGCYGANTNVSVQPNQQRTLSAGTYCGGLDLKGTVTLQPGLYIIKDGALTISSQASVSGNGVTFYLTGTGAGFTLNGGSAISLSATTTGAYQGMLIVQDRTANVGGGNTLNGSANTVLKGAIYTPTQKLTLNGSSGFGQASPFMPVIADQIKVTGNTTARADVAAVTTPAPMPTFGSSARLTN